MRRTTRSAAIVAATLSAALFVASCGSDDKPSDADKAKDAAKSAPKSDAMDINAQPVSKLKQGGKLRIPIRGWVTQFNRYHVDGSQGDATTVWEPALPRVFNYDAKGARTVNKNYVLSAEAAETGGKQVVTYKLNPKAKWSDGKQLSWKDFDAIWKANNGSDKAYRSGMVEDYQRVESVKKGADEQEVKVTFKEPQSEWQRYFTPILPASTIDTPKKFNEGWLEKLPLTAGPFKVKKFDKTAQTISLVPDSKWWGDKPKLDELVFLALDSDAQVDAYLNGELDYGLANNAEYYNRIKKAKNSEIRIGAPWDLSQLFYGKNGAMADVKVRQAAMMGVNRQAAADIQGKGMPIKPLPSNNHLLMPKQEGYKDTAGKFGKYDPAAAGKLLDAAGWKSAGEGKPRTKGGKKLTVNFVMSAGTSQTGVQSMLKQIGMDVKVNKVPDADFFEKYIYKGSFDMSLFRQTDATTKSEQYGSYAKGDGNYGKITSPAINTPFQKAMTEPDPAKATELFNQADAAIWESGHSQVLYENFSVAAYPKKLANYGSFGLASEDYTKVGWMK
jgi:peptide/nickel transport system substrate-binding protein